jgi:uncharacterized protein YggE
MRLVAIILSVVPLGSLGGCSQPTTPSSQANTLTVHGAATIATKPDRVSFSAGVETVDASAAEAFRRNGAKVEALLAALRKSGVTDEQMRTSFLDVSSIATRGRPQAEFRVSNQVTVTRDDPARVGDLIQAAIQAGANNVGGIRFFVGDPSAAQKRGLDLAYEDARSKAEGLAAKAGRTLGTVVSVTDQPVVGDGELASRTASLGYVGNQIVQAGAGEILCVVSVVFELR